MKPSSRQLIESIQWNLEHKVAPDLSSAWSLSTLRSIQGQLTHLATRVEIEAQSLFEDNRDAVGLLSAVARTLTAAGPVPELDELVRACTSAVASAADVADEFPTVGLLTELNDRLMDQVDAVVRQLNQSEGAVPADAREELTLSTNSYLRRRVARRAELLLPAGAMAPF